MSGENLNPCDCEDPESAICFARRLSGDCPQLSIVDQLKAQLMWLAEEWQVGANPDNSCEVVGATVDDILIAAQKAVEVEANYKRRC